MKASQFRLDKLAGPLLVIGSLLGLSADAAAESRDPLPVAVAIDQQIDARLLEAGIAASPAAEDAEFLRRVSLDLTGKLPTARQAAEFLDSQDSDKRRRLIDTLLASPDYGRHFSIIWQNLILPEQNDIQFVGLTGPDGIKNFGGWLERSFNENKPWDRFARDLIAAEGPIKENPAVLFTMSSMERALVRPDLLAVSTSRLFLGVQLQCVECHDHFFNDWKQRDFWGMAAFFGQTRFTVPTPFRPGAGAIEEFEGSRRGPFKINGPEITIPGTGGNKGAGKVVRAKFLKAAEPALENTEPFRPKLADWITSAENPYFAPAAVNRMWGHLFARGIVHPIDDMQAAHEASHPALLKLLSEEFQTSSYDLKHLIRCLTNSRVYQRTSNVFAGNEQDDSLVSQMPVKVMSPDVLYDALVQVLEVKQLDLDVPETVRLLLPPPERARLRFVRYFRTRAAEANEFARGVPHALSLMNSEALNAIPPAVQKLHQLMPDEAIEKLYLMTLSRRPSDGERELMRDYLASRSESSTAENYAAVLWILLNSSEFTLNH